MFKSAVLIATLAVIAVGGTFASVGAQDNTEATVELRVWQRASDPLRIDLSVRRAGGRWGRTERLPMAETSTSKAFRYTDRRVAVPVAGGTANVELRVWQRISHPRRVYLSARPQAPPAGRAERLPMAETNTKKTFRYTDRRVAVTPLAPEVPITFWGEVSEERQAEIRDEALSVVAYFADRYGLVEPGFELHVVTGSYSAGQAWKHALGGDNAPPLVCGRAVNEVVFIQEWCATATHDLTSPLAHEYFHVLQSHLVADAPGSILVSEWMVEGTAEYAATEYGVVKGYWEREDVDEALLKVATSEPWDLQDLESNLALSDTKGYDRVSFAVNHLVGQAGERAIVDFFQALPRLPDWKEAFAETFGMTTEKYYADFNAYVKEVSPEFAQVVLKVLGPDGKSLSVWSGLETRVTAYSFASNDVREDRSASVLDGVEGFHYSIPAGDYQFIARLPCERYEGEAYDPAVLVTIANLIGPTTVADGDEVVIQLPDWPSELNIHCSDHDRYPISGTLVSKGGHDVSKYRLSIQPVGIMGVFDLIAWGQRIQASENGTFETAAVPEGYDYRIVVRDACLGHGVNLGYYVEGGGLPRDKGRASVVTVDGSAVSGIRIELPESLRAADDCAWLQ